MKKSLCLIIIFIMTSFINSEELSKNATWYTNNHDSSQMNELFQRADSIKKLDEKIALYTQIIEQNNDSLTALVLRGIASGKLGNLSAAVNDFTRASEISPSDPFPVINRAYAYLLLHKYSESIKDYNNAIQMKPREASFYASRGYAYYIQKNPLKALADFKTALSFDAENDLYQHNINVIERETN